MTLDEIKSNKNEYNGLLIDTNIFLLLLIGIYDCNQIQKFKRTKKFSEENFDTLINVIDYFKAKIFITPHILTEVCNLSESYNNQRDNEIFKILEKLISQYKEENTSSISLIKNNTNAFYKFGIADSSIIDIAKQNTLIITDDADLYHIILSQNLPAINFTYLMDLNG